MTSQYPLRKKRLDELVEATEKTDRRLLVLERELMTTKWFGYRFMTPTEATLLFADLYREAVKALVRKYVDIGLANRVVGYNTMRLRAAGTE